MRSFHWVVLLATLFVSISFAQERTGSPCKSPESNIDQVFCSWLSADKELWVSLKKDKKEFDKALEAAKQKLGNYLGARELEYIEALRSPSAGVDQAPATPAHGKLADEWQEGLKSRIEMLEHEHSTLLLTQAANLGNVSRNEVRIALAETEASLKELKDLAQRAKDANAAVAKLPELPALSIQPITKWIDNARQRDWNWAAEILKRYEDVAAIAEKAIRPVK